MRIKVALSLVLTALIALFAAGAAQAATVVNQNDSGAGSLRQTVAEAGPGETINLPAGTYTLTSGPLQVTKALTISGHGAGDTTIRAGSAFRVIESSGEYPLAINDLTIRDGALITPAGILTGAAIYASNTDLALTRVAVTNNKAIADGLPGGNGGIVQGGAIYVSSAMLSLTESTVSNNTASANGGSERNGGIVQGGGIFVIGGQLAISSSTIADNPNSALGGPGPSNAGQNGGIIQGGGIFLIQNKEMTSTLAGATISGNSADVSGGLGASNGIVQGGGVFSIVGESNISITNSTIASNTARTAAPSGGIVQGAGMYQIASKPGGGAFLSTTLSGNRVEAPAPSGVGNLYATGPVSLRNSIVANGGGAKGTENCQISSEDPVSLGFNLDSLDQCGFKAAGDQVNKDPLLGPLQSNGGLTQTMAPALGSPTIDQGKSFGLTSDQRGILRPIDLPMIPNSAAAGADGSDIGAVEFQPSNAFALGKLTRNKKKGTARLSVLLPSPSAGTLTLSGKGLKTQTATIAGETEVKLLVALSSKKLKKALRKKGKRKVGINVTYAPTGNSAATQSRKAKLIKKKRKHKKRHPKPGKR